MVIKIQNTNRCVSRNQLNVILLLRCKSVHIQFYCRRAKDTWNLIVFSIIVLAHLKPEFDLFLMYAEDANPEMVFPIIFSQTVLPCQDAVSRHTFSCGLLSCLSIVRSNRLICKYLTLLLDHWHFYHFKRSTEVSKQSVE